MSTKSNEQGSHSLTLQDITSNPQIIAENLSLRDGETVMFRPLGSSDVTLFCIFLQELSEETSRRFQPHPLTIAAAEALCRNLDYEKTLRMLAVNRNLKVVGYFVLEFVFPNDERERYQRYGIELSNEKDCRLAPVVADKYQNTGIGSTLMARTIEISKLLDRRNIVLNGGTQATNERAIHFYEKFGFQKIGEFEESNINNYDMILPLK